MAFYHSRQVCFANASVRAINLDRRAVALAVLCTGSFTILFMENRSKLLLRKDDRPSLQPLKIVMIFKELRCNARL